MASALVRAVNLRGQPDNGAMVDDFDFFDTGIGSVTWEAADGRVRFTGAAGGSGDNALINVGSGWPEIGLDNWLVSRMRWLVLPADGSAIVHRKYLVFRPTDGVEPADARVAQDVIWNSGGSAWRFGLGEGGVPGTIGDEISPAHNIQLGVDYYIAMRARNVVGSGQNEVQELYVYNAVGTLLGSVTKVISQEGASVVKATTQGIYSGFSYVDFDWAVYSMALLSEDGGGSSPGPCVILSMLPASIDLDEGFTPVGAANEVLALTEALGGANGHDGDTSYIDNGTQTTQHVIRFGLTALPALPAGTQLKRIVGAQVNTVHRRTTASVPTIQIGLRSGASETLVTMPATSTAYLHGYGLINTDPATGTAWTTAGLEAAKLIIKDNDVQNFNFRTTMAWVDVVVEIEPVAGGGAGGQGYAGWQAPILIAAMAR